MTDTFDFSMTDKIIDFAVQTTVGSPQIVEANSRVYKEAAINLLPMVAWENNFVSPFSSFIIPDLALYTAQENYGEIVLKDYFKIDRVQANIGGNINLIVQKVDGTIFFNSAQSYIATYPAVFWWNNLNQHLYLYPIPTACIIKVFGRKLICLEQDRLVEDKLIKYPWVDPEIIQPYIFQFLGYSLAKAISIFYSMPWNEARDTHLDNLTQQLLEKQEESFIVQRNGPLLKKGRAANPGSIFTLGKGPLSS